MQLSSIIFNPFEFPGERIWELEDLSLRRYFYLKAQAELLGAGGTHGATPVYVWVLCWAVHLAIQDTCIIGLSGSISGSVSNPVTPIVA